MSVTIHAAKNKTSLFVTNENAATRHKAEKGTNDNKSTIFAGDLSVRADRISIIKQQAQKKAMKVLSDVFGTEKKLDQSIDDMSERSQELKEENVAFGKELRQIRADKDRLMEQCGVTEESQEHKDLELLRKERDATKADSGIELTEEEKNRLAEIHDTGVTDYQKDMLELDDREEFYQEKIEKNENKIIGISKSLNDIAIERLKSHPMVDAAKQADEIMDAANKEIYSELINEGKKHIEEKIEEEKEKAEKRAEKKEEEEKKAEAKEEREALQEEMIENAQNNSDTKVKIAQSSKTDHLDAADIERMTSYNSQKPETDKKLEEIIDELKLIQDDLKGAAIDTNI